MIQKQNNYFIYKFHCFLREQVHCIINTDLKRQIGGREYMKRAKNNGNEQQTCHKSVINAELKTYHTLHKINTRGTKLKVCEFSFFFFFIIIIGVFESRILFFKTQKSIGEKTNFGGEDTII